jgi:hypothetical protein
MNALVAEIEQQALVISKSGTGHVHEPVVSTYFP